MNDMTTNKEDIMTRAIFIGKDKDSLRYGETGMVVTSRIKDRYWKNILFYPDSEFDKWYEVNRADIYIDNISYPI